MCSTLPPMPPTATLFLLTDDFMAELMEHKLVSVSGTYGCKVFSTASMAEFFDWLAEVKSRMTPEHSRDLGWAYKRYRAYLS